MPSAASKILQACRQASRAARSAASAASRCAAVVARSGSGGAAASDPFIRSPSRSRPFGRGRFPIAAPPPESRGSGSTVAAPPTSILGSAPGMVKFVAEDEDLESDQALWALYERWCKVFNQERDHDEMARRFNTFKDAVLRVDKTNKADLPYKLGINKFADGKVAELRSPKVPIMEFYKGMPSTNCVTFERSAAFLFKKDLEGHELKTPNQCA